MLRTHQEVRNYEGEEGELLKTQKLKAKRQCIVPLSQQSNGQNNITAKLVVTSVH